jgi:hypothetical protein
MSQCGIRVGILILLFVLFHSHPTVHYISSYRLYIVKNIGTVVVLAKHIYISYVSIRNSELDPVESKKTMVFYKFRSGSKAPISSESFVESLLYVPLKYPPGR